MAEKSTKSHYLQLDGIFQILNQSSKNMTCADNDQEYPVPIHVTFRIYSNYTGCGGWTITAELDRKIHCLQMRCYRRPAKTMWRMRRFATGSGMLSECMMISQPLWRCGNSYCWPADHVSRSSGKSKTILYRTVKGARKELNKLLCFHSNPIVVFLYVLYM